MTWYLGIYNRAILLGIYDTNFVIFFEIKKSIFKLRNFILSILFIFKTFTIISWLLVIFYCVVVCNVLIYMLLCCVCVLWCVEKNKSPKGWKLGFYLIVKSKTIFFYYLLLFRFGWNKLERYLLFFIFLFLA